jgi:hypothetical protein
MSLQHSRDVGSGIIKVDKYNSDMDNAPVHDHRSTGMLDCSRLASLPTLLGWR